MQGSTRAALLLAALAMVALLLTACGSPTDAEAARDVAAQVSDARIDEWAQAALRANPDLSPEQLARVRTTARLIEQGVKPDYVPSYRTDIRPTLEKARRERGIPEAPR